MKVTIEIPDKKIMAAYSVIVFASGEDNDAIAKYQAQIEEAIKKGEIAIDTTKVNSDGLLHQIEFGLGIMAATQILGEKDNG